MDTNHNGAVLAVEGDRRPRQDGADSAALPPAGHASSADFASAIRPVETGWKSNTTFRSVGVRYVQL